MTVTERADVLAIGTREKPFRDLNSLNKKFLDVVQWTYHAPENNKNYKVSNPSYSGADEIFDLTVPNRFLPRLVINLMGNLVSYTYSLINIWLGTGGIY